jgi:bifunctional UDP-N-acetylglucosamine pyrophosphorylase/glucosamine-1-phosphate N-acetyltransferase
MVVAGCILREDILEDRRLVVVGAHREAKRRRYIPRTYGGLARVMRNNVIYLANLVALEQWYRAVRQPFFAKQELGPLVYEGALAVLAQAKAERIKRLRTMATKVPETNLCSADLRQNLDGLGELFTGGGAASAAAADPAGLAEAFLTGFSQATEGETSYIKAIKSLTPALSARGVLWLQETVDTLCASADELLPSLGICAPGKR